MRKTAWVAAACTAAAAVLIVTTLPPRRLTLSVGEADGAIPGIVHVHTNRSDGRSTPDEVAAAAERAGLKFLVFTDHGDATRTPDPPAYRSGVLCLDAVEISTNGGHYIALDMRAAPYPLGGEAADVVEDVRRLGGFGIAAHPDSPKPELQWRAWDAPIDAVELLNPDTSWRVWARLARTPLNGSGDRRWYARRRIAVSLLDYPFRSPEVIAGLMEPVAGERAVDEWAALGTRRRVASIAGIDAHALLALHGDPADGFSLPLPGYEASFRTLSIRARLDRPLSGDPGADGAALMGAIRGGHFYTAVDAVAAPASFEFTATTRSGVAREGDVVPAGQPLTLRVRSNAPSSFMTTVWSGRTVVSANHHENEFTVAVPSDPGMYWVEIRPGDRPNPVAWVRSNPIYVRGPQPDARQSSPAAAAKISQPVRDGPDTPAWHVEHDPLSVGAAEGTSAPDSGEWRFRFGLAGGAAVGQFVAFVHDLSRGRAVGDQIAFTARAERPMRVSVQLRGGDGVVDRWQKSVYVDTTEEERTVRFDDCTPVGATHTPKPPSDRLTNVMIVVDTTNTKPGTSGRLWVSHASLQR